MKMKRFLVLVLAAVMVTFSLSACDSSESSNDGAKTGTNEKNVEPKTIKLEFLQQKGEEAPQTAYAQIIERFREENKNIVIEQNTIPDPGNVLISRIAANDAPPIFTDYPTQMQFKQKVKNGYLECLTGHDFLNRVNQGVLEMSKANDGKNYALPLSQNYMCIYYNMDIFNEMSIDIPVTWEELMSACQKFEQAGIQPFLLSYKDLWCLGHIFQGLAISMNDGLVEYTVDVIEGEKKVADSAGYKALAEKILEITDYGNEDALGMSANQMWDLFANGQSAMIISGSYARGTILMANPDMNLGAFPIPNDEQDKTAVLTGVDAAICISGDATPQEKEAGLKFIEFISRVENAQLWSDTDGAPSCIKGTVYKNKGVLPVIDKINEGPIHDWMASSIQNNISNDLFTSVQAMIIERDIEAFLENVDKTIGNALQ